MNQFVRASSKEQTPPSIPPRPSSCQKQPRLSYDSSTASSLDRTLIETFEQGHVWLNAKGTPEELVVAS
jgi:hypothetical protein